MSPLGIIGQEDFSAGILWSSARDSEPGVGVAMARNGFFDDDGDIYMRGGDAIFSEFGPGIFTFCWSGFLNGSARTLVTTADDMAAYNATTDIFTTYSATPGLPAPTLPAVGSGIPGTGPPSVDRIYLTNGYCWDGAAVPLQWSNLLPASHQTISHVAACAGRLCVAHNNEIHFSNQGPLAGQPGQPTSFPVFAATDVHKLPDGVHVEGMLAIRDTLLVFTTFGVWAIGNMFYDLVDDLGNVQQTLNRIIPEMSLLGETGLAEWQGQIVVPAVDRVFLMDAQSAPIPISDSIAPLYAKLIGQGYRPRGAKVFRNHYFLPMRIDGDLASSIILACRLNRPVRGRQIYYPWSIIDAHAGSCQALDIRLVATKPALTGCSENNLINLTGLFEPGLNVVDYDSDFGIEYVPSFEVELRDLPTGGANQPNHIRFVRVWATIKRHASDTSGANVQVGLAGPNATQSYELLRDSSDDYQDVKDSYATYDDVIHNAAGAWRVSGQDPSRFYQLVGEIPYEDGFEPVRLEVDPTIRTRYTRALIHSLAAPFEQIRIHKIEFGIRQASHQR